MLYALRFIPYALYLCFILIYILYALILLLNKKFYLNKGAHPKKNESMEFVQRQGGGVNGDHLVVLK